MLIVEPRIVIIFWAHTPITFKHMPFWYPFWESHQITYHSNTCVTIKKITKLGFFTLQWAFTVDFILSSNDEKKNIISSINFTNMRTKAMEPIYYTRHIWTMWRRSDFQLPNGVGGMPHASNVWLLRTYLPHSQTLFDCSWYIVATWHLWIHLYYLPSDSECPWNRFRQLPSCTCHNYLELCNVFIIYYISHFSYQQKVELVVYSISTSLLGRKSHQ